MKLLMHIFLTVITGGLWLIVLAISAMLKSSRKNDEMTRFMRRRRWH